jgi:hypothetical protein
MYSFILKSRVKINSFQRPAFYSPITSVPNDWHSMATYVGPDKDEVQKAAFAKQAELMGASPDNDYQVDEVLITEAVGFVAVRMTEAQQEQIEKEAKRLKERFNF